MVCFETSFCPGFSVDSFWVAQFVYFVLWCLSVLVFVVDVFVVS